MFVTSPSYSLICVSKIGQEKTLDKFLCFPMAHRMSCRRLCTAQEVICNLALTCLWTSIPLSPLTLYVYIICSFSNVGFCGGSVSKKSTCNAGDLDSIPGLGISPGEGNGYPLQYSGLENSMDSGAWRAIVHWVTKSRTQLSNLHFSFLQYVILIQSSAHQKSFSLTGRSYFFFFFFALENIHSSSSFKLNPIPTMTPSLFILWQQSST